MRVVIADNYLLFREGLTKILAADPDYVVVGHAGTAREVVEQAVELQADLVLMDVNFTDGSGLEALREIAARRPMCKVVMLTSIESDHYLFESFRAGAKGYVLKSTSGGRLLKALNALQQGELVLSRQLTRRIIEEFVRLNKHDDGSAMAVGKLTARELEVLRLLGTGANNRDIAVRLVISENTVKVHTRNLREKLGLTKRSQVASFARRYGFVAPGWTPPETGSPRS